MPAPWNIVDCGLGEGSVGHHYWETKALAAELVGRGAEVRIVAYLDMPPDRIPSAQLIPAFRHFFYTSASSDPFWRSTEDFVIQNRHFERDLSRLDPKLFANAITLFPTIDENHLLGLLRWLAKFGDSARPKVLAVLHGLKDWSSSAAPERVYRAVWQGTPADVKKHIRLAVRSERGARAFEPIFGTKPVVLPSPVDLPRRSFAGPPPGPVTISFVGGARLDRGATMLSDIVKACSNTGARFFIQLKGENPALADEQFAALKGLPHVRLHVGMLRLEDYQTAIANSVVLLPYRAETYLTRISGVYIDAKCIGAPVIVPAGSWMSDEVVAQGSGVAFAQCSPESIAESIAKAVREYPALRANAIAAAEIYRSQHGAGRHVEAIESIFAPAL